MPLVLAILIEPVNVVLSILATLLRPWMGWRGRPAETTPAQPLILYEFEACPYCNVAREAVSALQLSADIRPCPKGGKRYRPEVAKRGGRTMFPYLIDPNAGVEMYESADIARYLYKTYGGRRPPPRLAPVLRDLNVLLATASILARLWSGVASRGRKQEVGEPLAFWGAEADPRARLVRETLCALEIPYRLHAVRPDDGAGLLLIDPNADVRISSSFTARRRLLRTYA